MKSSVLKPILIVLTILICGSLFAQRPIEAAGVTSKTKDGNTNPQLTLTDITSGQDEQTHTLRTNAFDAGPTLTIGTNSAYNHTLNIENSGAGDFNVDITGNLDAININSSGTITAGTLSGGTATKLAGLTTGNVIRDITVGSGLSLTSGTLSASGSIGGSTGSADNRVLRANGTGGSSIQSSDFVIEDISANNIDIHTTSTDGTDNQALRIGSGGAVSTSRGGQIILYGNESGSTGNVDIRGGDVTFGNIDFWTLNDGQFRFQQRGLTVLILDPDDGADFQSEDITTTGDITGGNLIGTTFTPTVTEIGAEISSSTANEKFYQRVGNVVTYTFDVDITAVAGCTGGGGGDQCLDMDFHFNLPVASNLADDQDYTILTSFTSGIGGSLSMDTSNDRISFTGSQTTSTTQTYTGTVMYIIK